LRVHGELLLLTDPAATFLWLDAYEEAGPAFPAPQAYRRIRLPVRACARALQPDPLPLPCAVETVETVEAWAYVWNRPVAGLTRLLSGAWPPARG
jgi:hypothetical protein